MTALKLVTATFVFLFVNAWAFRDDKPYYKWSPITFSSSGQKKFGKDLYRPFFVPQEQWTPFSASRYSDSPSSFSERSLRTKNRSCAKQGSSCATTIDGRWSCCEGLNCEMIRDSFGICLKPSWKTSNFHPIY